MDPADADGRVHRSWGDACSRGRAGGLPEARFYQASSSEMFGKVREVPQTELTPFYPRSPYGVAKTYGHFITVNYRESYGLHATSGYSLQPREPASRARVRHPQDHLARGGDQVGAGGQSCSSATWMRSATGDIAKDYVEAMWRMLQQDDAEDFVIATGVSHSVKRHVWRSPLTKPGSAIGDHVEIDESLRRPAEVDQLIGDRVQSGAHAGVGAGDKLRAADPADGRRRPSASAGRGPS